MSIFSLNIVKTLCASTHSEQITVFAMTTETMSKTATSTQISFFSDMILRPQTTEQRDDIKENMKLLVQDIRQRKSEGQEEKRLVNLERPDLEMAASSVCQLDLDEFLQSNEQLSQKECFNAEVCCDGVKKRSVLFKELFRQCTFCSN